jgi:DNA invertase Pin-like site-specific DNA recombinase
LASNDRSKDCRQLAARRGDRITRIYTDNDFSASNGKRRPDYERLLEQIRAGNHDGVIVWDLDRLHRQPKELEEFIDLADRFGLQLANVGGDVDLSTPQGRMVARIKGAVAKHETEQLARRVRRKHLELAEAGKDAGGPRPYGYLSDHHTPHTWAFCSRLTTKPHRDGRATGSTTWGGGLNGAGVTTR